MDKDIFCKIISEEIQSAKIFEDDDFIVTHLHMHLLGGKALN